MLLSEYDAGIADSLMSDMESEARPVVERGAPGRALEIAGRAYMRYVGQGYEIAVDLPPDRIADVGKAELLQRFESAYDRLYGRTIPSQDVEILSWTLTLSTAEEVAIEEAELPPPSGVETGDSVPVFDAPTSERVETWVYDRDRLEPGTTIAGPALIVEDQTTTVVTSAFDAAVNSLGYIVMTRRSDA